MRITTVLVGLLALAALGCNTTPTTPLAAGPATELVPLKVAFDETFPPTEGGKRVVLCQLNDERTQKSYLGEGPVAGDPTAVAKYVMKDDPTLVMPRVLAKELTTIGLNVAMAERLNEPVGGGPVRELLTRYSGDYLIAGRLEQLTLRARGQEGQPTLVVASARLDIYNKDGELRMYYPARYSGAEFLGDKAGDPEEMSRVVDHAVAKMFDVFDLGLLVPAPVLLLDLDNQVVRQLRASKPLCPPGPTTRVKPADTKPTEILPLEPKPLDTTPGEKPAEPKPEPPALTPKETPK